jgi:hypothetical protein
MSKTWSAKEWREKRAAYLVGKVCEMCSGSEKLGIHHRHPANLGLAKWKQIRRNLMRGKAGEGLSFEEITRVTNEKYAGFKARAELMYMEFTPDNVAVLCRRCHFAAEHGKTLCKRCRVHYHNPHFPVCFKCNKEMKNIK